jgi:hypothetical protein
MSWNEQWEAKINKGTSRMQKITSSSPPLWEKKKTKKKNSKEKTQKWPKENPTHAGSTTCH